jgi:hypothetical protein
MKPSIWGGLALYTVSLLAASFVDDMNLLILFHGIGPGEWARCYKGSSGAARIERAGI